MSADQWSGVGGPESSLGCKNVHWPTPNGQVQPASAQPGGSQSHEQPAQQHAQQTRPPTSAGPSSARSSMQPPSRGSSQDPFPVQPQVPPAHPQPSAAASDGVPAHSSSQVQEAPLSGSAASASQANLFRSPKGANATLENSSEYRELSDTIKRTRPDVVRQVVRDLWDKCLLGSEYHLAFIANATFHQASPSTLDRAVRDFGQKMVRSSKQNIIGHLTRQDFDELADMIYARVSNAFLDKGMARRLETIRARPLVNALARAERLGYDVRDIVEEKITANGVEHVVPSLQPMPGLAHPSQPVPLQPVPLQPVPLQPVPSQPLPSQPLPSQPLPSQHGTAASTTLPQLQASRGRSIGSPRDSNPPAPAGPPGPHGIVHCSRCGRPCSGLGAFQYHSTRRACEHTHKYDKIGKDICPHCGSLFGSSGGLSYHVKSKVCGDYDAVTEQAVLAELRSNSLKPSSMGIRAPVPQPTGIPTPTQPLHTTPGQMAAVTTNRTTPALTTPSRGPNTPQDDPYAKLTPQERLDFECDMKKGEEKYGALMQEAMKLPPAQREAELAKLKNSYNTKQSLTRKKYGIRLRERRSKLEIEAERSRLLGATADCSSSNTAGHQPAQKRARIGSDGQSASTQQDGYPDGTGQGSTPRKRPVLPDMGGGLTGVSGTAEHTDPTTFLTPSKSRSMAQAAQPQAFAQRGTSDDPMQIDDSNGSDDSGSDSDSDDDDIPAQLPAHTA
ncbi:Uncharacterized protein TPAR_08014 [Tolypocladium paradoxum]|uniref:Uncharacterized protein n=1 Tax=Tolypocladium paradoxum TaxID=94208 RepID=A0A2S4KNK3_9HYPO|nr:Uncharacterized protein TPAR_08014 [Tolypocladium paradoxum]